MRRLALIRYLYNNGVQQSREPEPLGLVSILTFHDSIELFLQLAAERLNVSKPGLSFMDYLRRVLSSKTLAEARFLKSSTRTHSDAEWSTPTTSTVATRRD